MKRPVYLVLFLAIIAVATGVLLSGASWIGRVGITLLHKEYNFLKIWWQGAIAVFLFYLVLVFINSLINRKMPALPARLLQLLLLIGTITGLYFTHYDFTHTFAHRLLGRRFHYGFYLFWVGWSVICLYYMLAGARAKTTTTTSGRTEQATL